MERATQPRGIVAEVGTLSGAHAPSCNTRFALRRAGARLGRQNMSGGDQASGLAAHPRRSAGVANLERYLTGSLWWRRWLQEELKIWL